MARVTLESLSADILILILGSGADLQTLKHAVHASPDFYRAYRAGRYTVLKYVLEHQQEGLVSRSDTIAVVRSQGLSAGNPAHKETIAAFLDDRQPIYNLPLDADEMIRALKFHDVALWVLEQYVKTMKCPAWMKRSFSSKDTPLRLPENESRHFFRGIYRFQIWLNLFGHANRNPETWEIWNGVFTEDEMIGIFLLRMPPWEIDEIISIWDLLEHILKTPGIPVDSADISDYKFQSLESSVISEYPANLLVMLGLAFARRLLTEADSKSQLKLARNSIDKDLIWFSWLEYTFHRYPDRIGAVEFLYPPSQTPPVA
ncbi:hypothetical protein BJX70DRAFT_273274 [Aspergillus crustosus]